LGEGDLGDNRGLYIEESLLNAVKGMLSGRVNEVLGEIVEKTTHNIHTKLVTQIVAE
jgi:hypothetical protein